MEGEEKEKKRLKKGVFIDCLLDAWICGKHIVLSFISVIRTISSSFVGSWGLLPFKLGPPDSRSSRTACHSFVHGFSKLARSHFSKTFIGLNIPPQSQMTLKILSFHLLLPSFYSFTLLLDHFHIGKKVARDMIHLNLFYNK